MSGRDVDLLATLNGEECHVLRVDESKRVAIIEMPCGSTIFMNGKIPLTKQLVKLDRLVFKKEDDV